jgi:peptidoglycan hydrolase-like protein with peptidoglycan-binding domain
MLVLGCVLAVAAPPFAQTSPSGKSTSAHSKKKRPRKASRRGQQKIDTQRAREIQEALIREHYLNGKASGVWDDTSQKAMQKYQADHGWQSKTTPDSRALIKLGLGPDHVHLLNPESAMTSESAPRSSPTPANSQPQR